MDRDSIRGLCEGVAMFAGAITVAAVLAGVGPWLDDQPDRRHEARQADEEAQLQRLAERWDREARTKCAEAGGENAGYIRTAWGGIVCTDKRGRKLVAQKGSQ